jgi:beta-alanine--pyruvate transaminase
MAKGINNAAVPMGAVIASKQIHDTIINATPAGIEFFHGYTYSAHPLAVASGIAAQKAIREEALYENVRRLAPVFEEAMHSLRDEPYVTDVRNIGLAGGLTLAQSKEGPGVRGYELFIKAYELGVAIRSNGDTIAIAPILNSTEADIEAIFDLVRQSLRVIS